MFLQSKRTKNQQSKKMSNSNSEIDSASLVEEASEYMKSCGWPNHFQAQFINLIAEEVKQSDNRKLKYYQPSFKSQESKAWHIANKVVLDYLSSLNLDLTNQTIELERAGGEEPVFEQYSNDDDVDKYLTELITNYGYEPDSIQERIEYLYDAANVDEKLNGEKNAPEATKAQEKPKQVEQPKPKQEEPKSGFGLNVKVGNAEAKLTLGGKKPSDDEKDNDVDFEIDLEDDSDNDEEQKPTQVKEEPKPVPVKEQPKPAPVPVKEQPKPAPAPVNQQAQPVIKQDDDIEDVEFDIDDDEEEDEEKPEPAPVAAKPASAPAKDDDEDVFDDEDMEIDLGDDDEDEEAQKPIMSQVKSPTSSPAKPAASPVKEEDDDDADFEIDLGDSDEDDKPAPIQAKPAPAQAKPAQPAPKAVDDDEEEEIQDAFEEFDDDEQPQHGVAAAPNSAEGSQEFDDNFGEEEDFDIDVQMDDDGGNFMITQPHNTSEADAHGLDSPTGRDDDMSYRFDDDEEEEGDGDPFSFN